MHYIKMNNLIVGYIKPQRSKITLPIIVKDELGSYQGISAKFSLYFLDQIAGSLNLEENLSSEEEAILFLAKKLPQTGEIFTFEYQNLILDIKNGKIICRSTKD